MLKQIREAPARTLALTASGTVMAGDIEAAVQACIGPSSAATGLVVVIDPEFDGYIAELARGIANVGLAHRSLVKVAVVAASDRMDEARLGGFTASAVPVRLFSVADRRLALDWASGASRGE